MFLNVQARIGELDRSGLEQVSGSLLGPLGFGIVQHRIAGGKYSGGWPPVGMKCGTRYCLVLFS
jgi:hypothetical protein